MPPTINAVHDDDLEEFLEGIEVLEKFKSGKLHCSFCKDVITFENLHLIIPDSGSIKFVCNKTNCIMDLKANMEGRKYG